MAEIEWRAREGSDRIFERHPVVMEDGVDRYLFRLAWMGYRSSPAYEQTGVWHLRERILEDAEDFKFTPLHQYRVRFRSLAITFAEIKDPPFDWANRQVAIRAVREL